jgi:hypothetical protein
MLTLLTRLFHGIWTGLPPPSSWLIAGIRPVHKPGKDPTLPESYRPISLLTTDYKLFTGVFNDRLQPFLTKIFPPHQTGFIKGRSTHLAAIRFSSMMKRFPNAVATLLDFEKAYDKVSHVWLFHVLENIGFPSPLITLLKSTHLNAIGTAIVNNRLSRPFPIRSGVRQGDPLSPVLFNFSLEPLLIALENISAYPQAHADDTALLLQDSASIPHVLNELSAYQQASGAALNVSKSISLARPTTPPWPSPFPLSYKTERYLGFGLTANGDLSLQPGTLERIEENLHQWKRLPLTYAAKCSLLMAYVRPRLIYQARIARIPPETLNRYTNLEHWFLSTSRVSFIPSKKYAAPPGLLRFHPKLYYRMKPLSLAVDLSRVNLLPSLTAFDERLLPSDDNPRAPSFIITSALISIASSLPFSTLRTTLLDDNPKIVAITFPHANLLRDAIMKALALSPPTLTRGQQLRREQFNTDFIGLWRLVTSLRLRASITTFAWRLLNGALPTGHKLDQSCPLCGGKETSSHLFLPECPPLESLGPPKSPLVTFLTPPHTKEQVKQSLLQMWAIWLLRNTLLHGKRPSSLLETFRSILSHEQERYHLNT